MILNFIRGISKNLINFVVFTKWSDMLMFTYRQHDTPEENPRFEEGNKNREGEGEGEDESIFETNWDESVEKFDDLNLKEEVLRGVFGYGFERPSPIQQKAILPILQGRDTIAQVSLYSFIIKKMFKRFCTIFNSIIF
jgi:hypothetical protein